MWVDISIWLTLCVIAGALFVEMPKIGESLRKIAIQLEYINGNLTKIRQIREKEEKKKEMLEND